MISHTSGPWPIEYDNLGNGGFTEWFNVGPAKIYFDRNERDKANANAHLIAAAPDLLEACQRSVTFAQAVDDSFVICDWAGAVEDLDAWLEMARNAITKATK